MKATSFKETNQVLGAGNNPNTVDLPVADLPVAFSTTPDIPNAVFVVSKWKMTPEEHLHFLKTGEIWLSVMTSPRSPTQPPVSLMVFNPFDHYNFESLDLT